MQRIIFTLFLISLSISAFADSPPCWCRFEEESPNKKFIAIIDRPQKDSQIEPWNSTWTLSVYEQTKKGKHLLWKIKYDYTGYPGGILSDDGKIFTYVEFWYYANSPLIDIYRAGKKLNTLELMGINFHVPKGKLVQTVSHHLWLWEEGNA